jgi:hypothetical protein
MCQYGSNFSAEQYPSEPADYNASAAGEAQPKPRIALSIKKAQMQPIAEKLETQVSFWPILSSLPHKCPA